MSSIETASTQPVAGQQALDARASKILARSLYRDMVKHGLGPEQVLAVTTELIEHVTEQLRAARECADAD
jgi:hypothetical protein